MNNTYLNSKSEILNPKQIQSNQIQNAKPSYALIHLRKEKLGTRFEHLNLRFRYCLAFRILRLGFLKKGVI